MGKVVGKFYGIGVGPGDPGLLTLNAVAALQKADVVFDVIGPNSRKSISGGILDSLELDAERYPLIFSMAADYDTRHRVIAANAELVAEQLNAGRICVFATIGDPMIYSTYIYLRDELLKIIPVLQVETIPGITSFQAVAAKSELSLVEDCETLCVVPAFTKENIDNFPVDSADTVVFLKSYHTRDKIIDFLKSKKLRFSGVYAARIGLEGEVVCKNIDEIKNFKEEYLSMLIVKIKRDR